eukprot:2656810-Prymnesium_polylepis.1
MARGPRLAAGGLCAHGLAVFGRSRRTLGRRPSAGACWPLRIVATGAKLQRRARLQRRAKAEWAELSWARPNGERLGSRRCRRHPSLPLFLWDTLRPARGQALHLAPERRELARRP